MDEGRETSYLSAVSHVEEEEGKEGGREDEEAKAWKVYKSKLNLVLLGEEEAGREEGGEEGSMSSLSAASSWKRSAEYVVEDDEGLTVKF